MKFNFPFETILKQKVLQEDVSKRDFHTAEDEVRISKNKIKDLWDIINLTRKKLTESQHSGEGKASIWASFDEFINGTKLKIERENKRLRDLIAVAEEKREILIEFSKERKILDRLKVKAKIKYKKARQKKEIKLLDELITTRFGRTKDV